jgi:methionine-rich copper-binding protein CopC
MDKKIIKKQISNIYKRLPLPAWIAIGALLVVGVSYSLIFFIPKKVQFSYANETCVQQLVLFPSAQTSKSDAFDVTIKDEARIGSFTYGATKVCVTPKQAPQSGKYTASIGLFGGWFASKPFSIEVSDPPVARKADIVDKAISTALPLKIALTSADTVHTYKLAIADKTSDCTNEDAQLVCNIADFGLKPGSEYTATLMRSFNDSKATKVVEGTIATLMPITLQTASLTDAKVVYDMPKEFSFTFDKPLETATVVLEQKNGEAPKKVETTTRYEGATLFVTVAADLARKADYAITVQQAVAEGGNSLDGPVVVNFKTSGGPKPASLSVGSTGVPQAAKIIVTLDQPVKAGVDIAKFARVEGVAGSVALRSPTELVYSMQGAGLCQAFSLIFNKGVQSGSNTEVSEDWKFDARTICGTSSVIGASSKGRPITAHYFGNGNKTILFTGGIHGTEGSSYTTMQAWVNHLMSNGYKIPADKRVIIVPNTNPDGIAAGTRYSATNVNLGRNFPTANWKADIETANGVQKNGGGTSPGSEPESKALMSLTRKFRPRLEVSFHAQGRLVGANKFGDSVAIGNTYASMVGYRTMFTDAEAVMGYPMTGEYEDWMGEEMNVPAILIELPSYSGNYLNSQLNALYRMLSV